MDFDQVLEEFNEQIASFYRLAPTKGEGEKAALAHGNEVLGQMDGMMAFLNDYPVYGAMAFYGKFQFTDKALITRLKNRRTEACEAIAAIREAKALRLSAAAKPVWDRLIQENPQALWLAIQLNLSVSIPYLAPRAEECEIDGEEGNDDNDDNDLNDDHDE